MDAHKPPYQMEQLLENQCHCSGKPEEATMNETLLLPAALRNDEITEKEYDALYRNVTDPNSTKGRLKRALRGIPLQEHEPVNS